MKREGAGSGERRATNGEATRAMAVTQERA